LTNAAVHCVKSLRFPLFKIDNSNVKK